ncbi:putative amidohydrolase [Polaribacter irgensii 23-P]|uniref:Omega-amidase YafV n=1 Tax=Polaribacter irgensii 23-P TaxID=313594 RepID=A4BXW0_9FLAO|nr:amidohydrolase [Polaribacter irgensii]EAR13801.1 putative amidohydrolase [Polaribacter irgensii 23-P]
MKNELKIIGLQAELIWHNSEQNIQHFEQQIDQLESSVDLIVLPEMFTSGFTMHPEQVAEQMDGFTVSWMQKIAKEKEAAICGSIVICEPVNVPTIAEKGKTHPSKNYYNRFIFVHPSGEIHCYDKRHCFTLAGEDKVYIAGNQKTLIPYKGWKICPLICYDLRFPAWSRNQEEYDLLIYVANWPIARIKAWESLLKARAIENMSYVIGVNRIGTDQNNYAYSGNSLILNYFGEILSDVEKDTNGVVNATIHRKEQAAIRTQLGFLKDMDSFKI